eukprot:GHRQ01027737.1.p1 GENE.GHRQ01027737.1~~GHRQ01027737.1.p1  ORF type:complete len:132 (-),score=8.50 GHRQ01027737.1:420-815(-)
MCSSHDNRQLTHKPSPICVMLLVDVAMAASYINVWYHVITGDRCPLCMHVQQSQSMLLQLQQNLLSLSCCGYCQLAADWRCTTAAAALLALHCKAPCAHRHRAGRRIAEQRLQSVARQLSVDDPTIALSTV